MLYYLYTETVKSDLSVDDLRYIDDSNIGSIENNRIFSNFIKEVEEYIIEKIDFFNSLCFFYFLAQAADNIIIIYLTFLKTFYDNKRKLQPESTQIKQIVIDIKSIKNSFNNLAKICNIDQANVLISARFDGLSDVITLINSDIMSEEFTETIQLILKKARKNPTQAIELSKFVELCVNLRSDHVRKKSIFLLNATSKAVDYTTDAVNSALNTAVKTFKRASITGFFNKDKGI